MSELVIKDKNEQARLWLYHKIADLENEIAVLREENERLRANAIIRRKWPEEKPEKSGAYVVFTGYTKDPDGGDHWVKDLYIKGSWLQIKEPIAWAEIPRPEGA
jgi:molybdopterin synthase catalytic subunit